MKLLMKRFPNNFLETNKSEEKFQKIVFNSNKVDNIIPEARVLSYTNKRNENISGLIQFTFLHIFTGIIFTLFSLI